METLPERVWEEDWQIRASLPAFAIGCLTKDNVMLSLTDWVQGAVEYPLSKRTTEPLVISFVPEVYVVVKDAGLLNIPSPRVCHKTVLAY